jgi:hypothetical protein
MTRIINFYCAIEGDDQGRMLADILNQDDRWLESVHDYIQWLFPNREPSEVTPWAPLITAEDESEFRNNEALKNRLMDSFCRMLAFYGMRISESRIVKAENWDERKHNWFIRDTHNNLRVTRILKCLVALGLENEARHFFNTLKSLVESELDSGISPTSIQFWTEAIES